MSPTAGFAIQNGPKAYVSSIDAIPTKERFQVLDGFLVRVDKKSIANDENLAQKLATLDIILLN